jgi:hypothetical protein
VLAGTPTASLAWLLWAWARAERWRPPRTLLRRVEAALHRRMDQLYGLHPADVATLAWSLAQLQCYSGGWVGMTCAACSSAAPASPAVAVAGLLGHGRRSRRRLRVLRAGALLADLAAVCRSMWERMDPQVGGGG